jgi:two-component system cell cycle response regulator DivK
VVGPLILVVDDTRDSRELFVEFLRMAGFRAEQAATGAEALDKAAALRPSAIVMDLEMPEMDGWEATRRLKADERTCSIPVVALSAHVMEGARMKAIEAGCMGFLPKPCYPSQVSEELNRILGLTAPSASGRTRLE